MSEYKILNNSNCDLDFNEVKTELLALFKSPNPFYVYQNSKNIKDKFSYFLTCITTKIANWFSIEDDAKGFMFTIYKQSNYHKIWIRELQNYLRESKNFDVLNYIYFVKTLNNDKFCLAVWLFKLYRNENEKYINDFLVKNNSFFNLNYIKKVFDDFEISKLTFDITLKQEQVEHFIEKIYFQLDESKKKRFIDIFSIRIDKDKIDYEKWVKILQKVIDSYVTPDKIDRLNKTINNPEYSQIKTEVDDLILNYLTNRYNFYFDISTKIAHLPSIDRYSFWLYIKTNLINIYYKEIKYLFYDYSSNIFLNKEQYSNLKWNFKQIEIISPEAKYLFWELQELIELKNLILELNNNLFSFVLLPIVYILVSEKLSIPKKDLYKLKYLLLYIFSSNYSEYKNIYKFFNQLEIFLNYENSWSVIAKIQVSFSLFLLAWIWLFLSYHYLPIGVFIGILMLFLVKYTESMYPSFYFRQKWNIWFKFFAIMFLAVSSYFWFQNFDEVINKTKDLSSKVEVLWTLPTKNVLWESYEYLKASLFDLNK